MCGPLAADSELCQVKVDGCRIRAGAGASLLKIAMAAKDAGLAGLEFAAGIPGSLGGAVMMNAGAYNGEMKQVVRSVRILDTAAGIKRYSDAEMAFGYRTSRLKKESGIVLSAEMELEPGDKQAITDKITELAQKRREKQPLEFASAGSTFKRPEGYFAGKLIQDAGLRGFSIGDAQVSEKHAGFVINRGGATFDDVMRLIDHIRSEVLRTSGIELETEVKIIR
jgi:UDP-N-acetylmuramate dehydrogenase